MKKVSVTVGIAAYNEEANIGEMLKSVFVQKTRNIFIKEIVVISDGSSDKTLAVVKSFKNKKITIINHRVRHGQPSRLKEIFSYVKTDVLVIVDADNVLGSKNAIENIVRPLRNDKKVGVVAGNTIPTPGVTLLEKAINNYIYARQSLQSEYNFGKKALVAHAYLAYSKDFLKTCYFPDDILNFDAYSYFIASKKGFKFGYAHDSISYYRSARHIKEYVNQTTRHITGGKQLYNYFSKNVVDEGFSVPRSIMKKIMLYQVKANIIGYLLVKVLFSFCMYRSKRPGEAVNAKWDFVASTKSRILL